MTQAALLYYVEDDEHIRDLTAYALEQAGFEVRTFADAAGFVELCMREVPDAILLDIMLPGDDGITVLHKLRETPATADVPVMMLTAKGTEFDTVSGLDAGADDYLAKPFGMMELISRVNALLRRAAKRESASGIEDDGEVLHVSDIELSIPARSVTVGGAPVPLTLKEFDLLRVLMLNKGHVLSRDRLLELVWDIQYAGETRTVDAHVKTLRHKLEEARPGAGELIETVRGVGYVLRTGDRS